MTFHPLKMAFHGHKVTLYPRKMAFHGHKVSFHPRKMTFHGHKVSFHPRKMTFHGLETAVCGGGRGGEAWGVAGYHDGYGASVASAVLG